MDKDKLLKTLFQELKKGTLTLVVLGLLEKKHYGYSLVDTLQAHEIEIDQNTLYPLLRRLEQQHLLDASWEVSDPRPRKYYQRTEFGDTVFLALKAHYESSHKKIQSLLEEVKKDD